MKNKARKGDLCSEFTSMQITRSCCFDCQGTFHVHRSEDLRTFGFFWRSECKLIKNIFDIRKIFVSAKYDEAVYIVNMKKNKTKTHTPQFSLLISFLCNVLVDLRGEGGGATYS